MNWFNKISKYIDRLPSDEEWDDPVPGGMAQNKKPSDFDKKQLEKGIKIEFEHNAVKDKPTDKDIEESADISMDHQTESKDYKDENGGKYYDELDDAEKRIEKKLENKKSSGEFEMKKYFNLIKEAKIPKNELTPVNPFAVCHTSTKAKKGSPKFERCVQDIKKQNRKSHKKASIDDIDILEGINEENISKLAYIRQDEMEEGGLRGRGFSPMEEEIEPEGELQTSEPEEGDYIMFDSGSLGGKTSVAQKGYPKGFLGEFNSREEAEAFIKQHASKSQFFPSVWVMSDHGNYIPAEGFNYDTLANSNENIKIAQLSEDSIYYEEFKRTIEILNELKRLDKKIMEFHKIEAEIYNAYESDTKRTQYLNISLQLAAKAKETINQKYINHPEVAQLLNDRIEWMESNIKNIITDSEKIANSNENIKEAQIRNRNVPVSLEPERDKEIESRENALDNYELKRLGNRPEDGDYVITENLSGAVVVSVHPTGILGGFNSLEEAKKFITQDAYEKGEYPSVWEGIKGRFRKIDFNYDEYAEELMDYASGTFNMSKFAAKKKKKWMQEAVEKPGSFTDYCKGKGYKGVTEKCIQEGKASTDPTTKKRANLAKTFRKTKKKADNELKLNKEAQNDPDDGYDFSTYPPTPKMFGRKKRYEDEDFGPPIVGFVRTIYNKNGKWFDAQKNKFLPDTISNLINKLGFGNEKDVEIDFGVKDVHSDYGNPTIISFGIGGMESPSYNAKSKEAYQFNELTDFYDNEIDEEYDKEFSRRY